MVPLRIAGIVTTIFFILWLLRQAYPTLFMYLFLLPLERLPAVADAGAVEGENLGERRSVDLGSGRS